MKFPKFNAKAKKNGEKPLTPKESGKTNITSPKSGKKPSSDGRKQIISGLALISISFIGAVFLLYLTVNSQRTKETQLREMKKDLVLVQTENEIAKEKSKQLKSEIGRTIDLDKVIDASEKIHDDQESARKQGSMWINRKTQACMVTLGVLNGVATGSRLAVYAGDDKVGTVKITAALDVVSYAEPVDKNLKDFTKDYYAVKIE